MNYNKIIIRKNRINGYLFLLPNIIGFMLFVFLPVIASLVISFTNWDGFSQFSFVGLDNFRKMFSNSSFQTSLANTGVYTFFSVPVTLAFALILAVILNRKIKGRNFFRTAIFIPYISASVAIAVVWQMLFHPTLGPVNSMLLSLGISNPPGWLSSSDWAMSGVIIVSIWKRVGYFMIIFMAGLQGIPRPLYEAADIDGAGVLSQFFKITVPMMSPTIFFALIIGLIQSFKVFDLIYTLTEGGPGRSTTVLAYTVYQESFIKYKFGYASAVSYVLFVIILIITLIQFRGQKKWVQYM